MDPKKLKSERKCNDAVNFLTQRNFKVTSVNCENFVKNTHISTLILHCHCLYKWKMQLELSSINLLELFQNNCHHRPKHLVSH